MTIRTRDTYIATAFETDLGWMALLGHGARLVQSTIGHATPVQALAALDKSAIELAGGLLRIGAWDKQLVKRLRSFAAGRRDDFLDVEIESGEQTPFARRVIACCRRIPCGETLSYGELARCAKAPRAARAVGSVMATNRLALIVPCHRVVRAGGAIGGYSSPSGVELKRRLLRHEAEMGG